MVETFLWLAFIGGTVFLLWKGGVYRWMGIGLLLLGGYIAEKRFRYAKKSLMTKERQVHDEFSSKFAPTVRERRRYLIEQRQRREELEQIETKYQEAAADRDDRVAELWNAAFGRKGGSE